jgi:hypothetical protein
MEIIGTIKKISDLQKVTDKFTKQEFVLTTDGDTKYPQHIQFQCVQDRCSQLSSLQAGDAVRVFYNLKGKEYTDKEGNVKIFNSIECWKIDKYNS